MTLRAVFRDPLRDVLRDVLSSDGASLRDQVVAALFGASEQGALYDPSDISTLYQDSAGTTPVAADGDPVGRMEDLTGNGNHATQATAAARPIYRTDGTKHWLEMDGVDAHLLVSPTCQGAIGSDNTLVFGVETDGVGGNIYVVGGESDRGLLMLTNGSNANLRPGVQTTSGFVIATGTEIFHEAPLVYSMDWDRSAGVIRGWGNTTLDVTATGTAADKTVPVTFAIGGRGKDSPYFVGRIYGGLIVDTKLSDSDRGLAESWIADISGATLP